MIPFTDAIDNGVVYVNPSAVVTVKGDTWKGQPATSIALIDKSLIYVKETPDEVQQKLFPLQLASNRVEFA